jgi:hypothetical protein
MKKRRAIVLALAVVLLLLMAVYLWGPSRVPTGQKPLFRLSGANFSEFEKAFDDDAGVLRLVLLLSPT